jgi:hypothetical protein
MTALGMAITMTKERLSAKSRPSSMNPRYFSLEVVMKKLVHNSEPPDGEGQIE